MSNINVYADQGVVCQTTPCHQSVSNTKYFPDGQTTSAGNLPGVGVSQVNLNPLVNELLAAKSVIAALTAESTITNSFNNGSSSLNLDAIDTNNDGIAVIDINVGGSDFQLNNYDWILNGSDVFAIFRIRGNSNMLLSNSSIALGPGGIGNGTANKAPDQLGAVFVHYQENAGSGDKVFSGNNVILNGVGLWDLNAFSSGSYNQNVKTEVNIQNGQGCSQFIGGAVIQSNVRWNQCGPASASQAIPEPLTLMGASTAAGFGFFFKRKVARKSRRDTL